MPKRTVHSPGERAETALALLVGERSASLTERLVGQATVEGVCAQAWSIPDVSGPRWKSNRR